MKLYLTDTSGNSYKVRVLCSILNVPYETYPAVVSWLARCEAFPGWLKLD